MKNRRDLHGLVDRIYILIKTDLWLGMILPCCLSGFEKFIELHHISLGLHLD